MNTYVKKQLTYVKIKQNAYVNKQLSYLKVNKMNT